MKRKQVIELRRSVRLAVRAAKRLEEAYEYRTFGRVWRVLRDCSEDSTLEQSARDFFKATNAAMEEQRSAFRVATTRHQREIQSLATVLGVSE